MGAGSGEGAGAGMRGGPNGIVGQSRRQAL